ncbi:MAG: hypothetical protein WCF16_01430 [Alphaproteobacteria bacterium]
MSGSDGDRRNGDADIDAIAARCKAAAAGPWEVIEDEVVDAAWVNAATPSDDKPIALFDYRAGAENKANAHFVAQARQDIPALIELVRGLKRRVADLLAANNRETAARIESNAKLQDALAKLERLGAPKP